MMKHFIIMLTLLAVFPTAVFSGCINGNCTNGLGYFQFDQSGNHKYIGYFRSGLFHGPGIEISDGIPTSGIWEAGMLVEALDIGSLDLPPFFMEEIEVPELEHSSPEQDTRSVKAPWFEWLTRVEVVVSIMAGLTGIIFSVRQWRK